MYQDQYNNDTCTGELSRHILCN